jgi:hypothetical protein
MRYVPIIVPIILALGIAAVVLYRPNGAVRINSLQPTQTLVG